MPPLAVQHQIQMERRGSAKGGSARSIANREESSAISTLSVLSETNQLLFPHALRIAWAMMCRLVLENALRIETKRCIFHRARSAMSTLSVLSETNQLLRTYG